MERWLGWLVVSMFTIAVTTSAITGQPPSAACPPIPNCAVGTTCKPYPHPKDCFYCKCEKCPEIPCQPLKGEMCQIVASPDGCGTCRCSPCPDLPACGPGCEKFVPERGCTFCHCNARPDPEHESGNEPGSQPSASDIHDNVQRPETDDDNLQRPERIESQRPINPSDP